MADFEPAIDFTLKQEGGFSNVRGDHGGATAYGISLKFMQGLEKKGLTEWADIDHDGLVTAKDIKALMADKPRAVALYKKFFWDAYPLAKLDCQPIATKIFDILVNLRPAEGVTIVQRACNALGAGLVEDHQFGPKTVAAVNQLAAASAVKLMYMLREFQKAFYVHLVQQDLTQAKFFDGWMARAGS